MKLFKTLVLPVCLLASTVSMAASLQFKAPHPHYLNVKHQGYELVMDCVQKSAVMFKFTLVKDAGNVHRFDHFDFDPTVPRFCQQKTPKPYVNRHLHKWFARGHLVGANSQDWSKKSMRESFYITNVVPQAGKFNSGAWLVTEELQEMLREKSKIIVLGGVVYNDPSNDYFVKSHGIKTPDLFWKIIITDQGYYAWLFPNTNSMVKSAIRLQETSIEEIEKTIGYKLQLGDLKKLHIDSYKMNRRLLS